MRLVQVLIAFCCAVAGACASGLGAAPGTGVAPTGPLVPTTRLPAETSAPGTAPPASPPPTSAPPATVGPVVVTFRIERRTLDPATEDFEAVVRETLTAPQGWQQAGFVLGESPDAAHSVVLAEPDEAQALCLPYDVYRTYSCQNGPTVVLNAARWREATPEWTGDIATYRRMLVNHEFGHLLGQRHVPCVPGLPAPVMCQQSTELHGAIPGAVPLPEEIARAARHDQPIAPGPGE